MKDERPGRRKGPRKPKKVTAARLENVALHHLQRFSTTRAGLARVLDRRVWRATREHGPEQKTVATPLIGELLDRCERSGLIDDRRFAQNRARALLERGTSFRGIAARLRVKGVATEVVEETLDALRGDAPEVEPELQAAQRLAQRRRLGPHRPPESRKERRTKDLAVLLRAGFGYGIARRVIDG